MNWGKAVFCLAFSVPILSAAPDIDSISPFALRPGKATEITFSGSEIAEARQLWTSFPATVDSLGEGRFRITANVYPGIGALRVFGSNGVSGLGFVVLDDLPVVKDSATNTLKATAQRLEFGTAAEGQAKELGYKWFRFRANKGQRVNIETVGARIGSKLDSILRVLNAAGRELARNDDLPGASGDSYLNFTASESNDYFIELRDVNYGGGSSFFYHLRVGNFSPLPRMFASVGDKNLVVEKEPNDTPAKSMKISLTNQISGSFGKAGDRDMFAFTARKDERLEFRAATRSLGSACDIALELDSAAGKRLARSNPSDADEGVLTYTFPSNATYRLIVEEVTGAFGSNLNYRLSARPAAGFAITLDRNRVNFSPGKSFDLKVTARRGDYKGAIALGIEGMTEPPVLTNNVIAEGKTNVTMKVTIPDSCVPGTWKPISVVGIAKRGRNEFRVRANTAPALRKSLPQLLLPPPEFDGEVALGILQPKE